MSVSLPRIAVGIPIPDCNFSTPRPAQSASPGSAGWTCGGNSILGTVMMHPGRGGSSEANPYGTGAGMRVTFASNHSGSWTSYPSPWGMVPVNTISDQTIRTTILLIHCGSMSSHETAYWKLRQYDEDGVQIGSDIGLASFSSVSSPSEWVGYQADLGCTWDKDCRYVTLYCLHTSSANDAGWYGIDFVGLGFNANASGDFEEFVRFYDADGGIDHTFESDIRSNRVPYGGFSRHVLTGTGQARATFDMGFSGLSQTGRDLLLYYWRANKGSPTGINYPNQSNYPILGGHAWPLLLMPGRTGIKQGLYCSISGSSFPIGVDSSLGWIPDSILWKGRLKLIEEFF